MKLAVRGFVKLQHGQWGRRTKKFEDVLDVPVLALDEVLPELAKKHAAALAASELHMIEIEFLDDPADPHRFFRFGTDPGGMVVPMKVDLTEPYQFPTHCVECHAFLQGSLTRHTDDCEIGKLIRGLPQ